MNAAATADTQHWIKGESTKEQIAWCDAVRWFNDATIDDVMHFIEGTHIDEEKVLGVETWYKQVIEAKQQELLA